MGALTPAALDRALAAAVDAARAAGKIALGYYHGGFEITIKPDLTPVTQADREAEQAIVGILREAFPDVGVLGEEFGAQGPRERRFIIDPIDGTKNFVRRIPIWATLIALEDDGEVVAGVIHNPATGEMYTARRGGGAQLNGVPVHVSDVADLGAAYLIHAGLDILRRGPNWEGFLRLVDASGRQRGFGDYIGYGFVADGRSEIYAEADLKPWDLAPCKIVVEEAGGRFTDFDGRPTIYTGTALATNGRLHDAALSLLRV
ncbi:MAG TPA: inositol monophosphatase family protein [Candidatus Acidoferrum sp.]|nr:inositol monophosphatase family protein [Candidatus Acidoferrum sp.]